MIAVIRNRLENSVNNLEDLSPFINILIKLLDEFEFPKSKTIDIYDKTNLTDEERKMAESFKKQFLLKFSDLIK